MKNILIQLHNFVHNTSANISAWAQANPYKALLIIVFLAGIIVGALFL